MSGFYKKPPQLRQTADAILQKHPDGALERLHLHWFTSILLAERSIFMPSVLRDDLMHPARVAHASMHQFARNATDEGNDALADEALMIAKQINSLLEGQALRTQPRATARPATRLQQPPEAQ